MDQRLNRAAQWMNGKPGALAMLGIEAASFADELYWILRCLRDGEFPPRLPLPPSAAQNLRFYRRHRAVFNAIGAEMGFNKAGPGSASALANGARAFDRMPAEDRKAAIDVAIRSLKPEDAAERQRRADEFHRQALHDLLPQAEDRSAASDADAMRIMSDPAIQFYIWVWLPCWVLYREYPATLLFRARHGDIGALEKLLRVDKSILADPRVANEVHQAFRIKGRARLKRLANAIGGGPIGPITRAKVKRGLAGLVAKMGEKLGHPMEEPAIRELFDSVAAAKGYVRDRELPASSETLSKSLQRERPTWLQPPLPGQKSR